MIFGRIDFLNLLPFHLFMKKYIQNSSSKKAMGYYKNVPSKINKLFERKKVDAAFISSVKAKKFKKTKLGIVAKKNVKSVIVIPSTTNTLDCDSATSNKLAKLLNINGTVLIGDKALRCTLRGDEVIDLAEVWNDKYNLPFVFAVLCFHKQSRVFKKIEEKFLLHPVKIPQYILQNASRQTAISKKEILNYLNLISYEIGPKERMALKKFYSLI